MRIGYWAGVAVVVATFTHHPAPAEAQTRPTFHLDTVYIRAASHVAPSLSSRTRTVAVITRADIEAMPARSIGDLLRWANGVDLQQRSGAQSDVSIRGAGFEQVLVLVDGVRVSDVQSGHFDLDLAVPIDRIERIEILRGPASALFGADAVGGVLNVVTRAPGAMREGAALGTESVALASLRAERGSYGTTRLSATQNAVVGGLRFAMGQEWAESDGDRTGTDFENLIVHGALAGPAAGGAFEVNGGYARRDFGAADFYAPIPAYEETRTGRVAATWRSAAFRGVQVESRVAYRAHDDRFVFFRDEPTRGSNQHQAKQIGAELMVRSAEGATGRASWAVGIEGWDDDLESSNLGTRSERRAALFGELVAEMGDRTILTVGARGDTHDEYGDAFSPSLSAAYALTNAIRLKGSIARSFRAPTWTERYYVDPFHQASNGIAPERTWSYEAGVRVVPNRGLAVGVTGFLNDTEDLIDWAKPDGSDNTVRWNTRNVSQARFLGVEVDAEVTDLAGVWGRLAVSFIDLDASSAVGFFSKRALQPEQRRVSLAAGRSVLGRVELAAHGLYAKRVDQVDYHQMDARVAVLVGNGALYVDVTNITDQAYLDASGAPVNGAGVFVGYRIGR